MNQAESIASSWLTPQVGFQLSQEQFKVPELVGPSLELLPHCYHRSANYWETTATRDAGSTAFKWSNWVSRTCQRTWSFFVSIGAVGSE
jgi:hypothetical protein